MTNIVWLQESPAGFRWRCDQCKRAGPRNQTRELAEAGARRHAGMHEAKARTGAR